MSVLLGIAVGLILGLTGAGGSVLAVPLLMAGLGWSLTQAVPVALLAVAAAAVLGAWLAWRQSYVRYRAALLMSVLGLLVAPLGLRMAERLPATTLALLFAAVLGIVAVRMLRQSLQAPGEAAVLRATVAGDGAPARGAICQLNADGRIRWTPRCAALMSAIGAGAGFLSGLLGVGGGFVIVPSLRAASPLSMHSAVATSLMVIAIVSAGTALGAVLQGRALPWMVALPFVAGGLLGMLGGRRLSRHLPGVRLQQGFALLMLLTAAGMALHGLDFF